MYLLIACSTSWLCLLGAFTTTRMLLPSPRSTTDLVVIIVVGAAALAFTRLGMASLLALVIRALPAGRIRTAATAAALRLVPALLRSSVLAAVSASLVVGAAHAAPVPTGGFGAVAAERPLAQPSSTPPDPGWPTVPNEPAPSPHPPSPSSPAETRHPAPLDPGWPSSPPSDSDAEEPPDDATGAPDDVAQPDTPQPDTPQPGTESDTHIVAAGESLWSIAARLSDSNSSASDLADEIYADNRDMIGADPNLIMPGQRLEIQP